MDAFLLELGVILLLLGLSANVAGRLGLSAIPFFLLAGLVLGEGGLHEFGASVEFIEAAGELGVLLLLLLLGLDSPRPSSPPQCDGTRHPAWSTWC